jgi:hypothetical protein
VDEGLGATSDEEGAATKYVVCFPPAFGVDVGLRQHAAAKQDGNLVGVGLVGLGLAAVDNFPVERVSEDSSLSPPAGELYHPPGPVRVSD